jgi:hypothetical protein
LRYKSIANSDPNDIPWPEWTAVSGVPIVRKRYGIKEKPFSHLLGEIDPKNPKAKLPTPPQIYAGAPKEYKLMNSNRPPIRIGPGSPNLLPLSNFSSSSQPQSPKVDENVLSKKS